MINSWSIKVGDSFRKGDRLCEIALPVATIGIDAKEDGTLAKIIVDQYKTVPADSEIALYTLSREKFLEFIAESMVDAQEAEKLAEIAELEEEKIHKPDAATLMRVIKHMIQQGSIKSGSGKLLLFDFFA